MQWAKNKQGFTIVELLIVVVVIAILAAITIVAYNGIQNRAKASAVQSATSQAAKKVALWQVDNPGQSPDQATFDSLVGPNGSNTSYQYTQGGNGEFCLTATANGVSYFSNNNSSPTSGGCPGHAQNGRSSITNIVTNPSLETNANYYAVSAGNGGGVASGARVATGGLHGPAYYRATWSTAPTSTGGLYIQNAASTANSVVAGQQYYFRSSVRSSWAATMRLTIVWWNASNSTISSVPGTNATTQPNQWTTLEGSSVAPAGAVRVRYLAESVGALPAVGSTFDIDGMMAAVGTGPYNYADGSSSNWIWNGTAHDSSSTGPQL